MAINRLGLMLATSLHLAPDLAERMEAALEAMPLGPELQDKDVGRAIAIAASLLPPKDVAPQVDALTLTSVEIEGSQDSYHLTAQDAFGHPMLAEWIESTFADMVGEAVRSGRIGSFMPNNAPTFDTFMQVESGGRVHIGVVRMIFQTKGGPVGVKANYGRQPDAAYQRSSLIFGNQLATVGVMLRNTEPLHFMPPPEERHRNDEPPPEAGAVVH